MDKQYQQEDIQELMSKLLEDVRNISEEFSEYINCPSWNRPLFYFDDDDDEYTIDFLLKEFAGELAPINPISPGIIKANFDPEEEIRLVENLLYDNSSSRPPKELNLENVETIIESLSLHLLSLSRD
ncbi:hypothetical protein Tco_0608549 [Tanacetum coccineum]